MSAEQEPRPTPELLPCPFCGGSPWISEDDHGNPRWVLCEICACDGPTPTNADSDGIEEVARSWNHRVPLPRTLTPEQVERARRLLNDRDDYSHNLQLRAFELLREVVGDE